MAVVLDFHDLSVDEIRDEWMKLETIRLEATQFVKQWRNTEPRCGHADCKAAYAQEMDVLDRESRVMDAWCNAVHAAWTFAKFGEQCIFLEGQFETGTGAPPGDREI